MVPVSTVTSTILVGGRLFYIDSQKGAVDLTAKYRSGPRLVPPVPFKGTVH